MVSYETGQFSVKRYYRIVFLSGSGSILLLMKAIRRLCGESVEAAAQRNVFNVIMASHMRTFSTPSEVRYEC